MRPKHLPSPLLLFDGVCNLCNGTVQWVIRHDPEGRIRFASLQSETGRRIRREAGHGDKTLDTVLLYDDGRIYHRSDAVLRLLRHLGGGWRLLAGLSLIPRPLRNGIYDWVAANRYRWFGRRESCMLPTPELKSRFIDS